MKTRFTRVYTDRQFAICQATIAARYFAQHLDAEGEGRARGRLTELSPNAAELELAAAVMAAGRAYVVRNRKEPDLGEWLVAEGRNHPSGWHSIHLFSTFGFKLANHTTVNVAIEDAVGRGMPFMAYGSYADAVAHAAFTVCPAEMGEYLTAANDAAENTQ